MQSFETGLPGNGPIPDDLPEGFYRDVDDPAKFHRVVTIDGKKQIFDFSCGEGTIWDPEIGVCNHPWAVQPPRSDKATPAY